MPGPSYVFVTSNVFCDLLNKIKDNKKLIEYNIKELATIPSSLTDPIIDTRTTDYISKLLK